MKGTYNAECDREQCVRVMNWCCLNLFVRHVTLRRISQLSQLIQCKSLVSQFFVSLSFDKKHIESCQTHVDTFGVEFHLREFEN